MRTNHSLSLLAAAVLAAGGSAVVAGIGIAGTASTGPSKSERAQLLNDKIDRATPPPGQQAPPASNSPQQDCSADMPANVSAAWRFKPTSMAEVRAKAQTIVLADVESVEQLPDAVMSAPGEPSGEIRTPMQSVRLKVSKAYKGAAEGDTITVSKLGSDCFRVEEDPAYEKGETQLLMLERGPGSGLQAVSPEGRSKLTDEGTLQPVGHSSVAQSARGKRPDAIAR